MTVRQQSYSNIEVLLVDDCSTDGSQAIARHYTLLDPRFKLIISQHNEGLSGARNKALAQVKGEFISFVDSDDWLEPNFIEELVRSIAIADMAMVNIVYEKNSGSFSKKNYLPINTPIFFNDLKRQIEHFPCYIWAFLFRATLIKEFKLRFPVGLYFEDMLFFWQAVSCSNKGIIYTGKELYHYRYQRIGSITRDLNRTIDALSIIQQMEELFSAKNLLDVSLKSSLNAMHYERTGGYIYFILYGQPRQKRHLFLNQLTDQWQKSTLTADSRVSLRIIRSIVLHKPFGWRFFLMVIDWIRRVKASMPTLGINL